MTSEHRRLGERGPQVSTLGLGCNNFGMKLDLAASTAVVRAALDAGITHFDTAELYGGGASEEHLGAALGSDRRRVVVATKFQPRPTGEPRTRRTPSVRHSHSELVTEGRCRRSCPCRGASAAPRYRRSTVVHQPRRRHPDFPARTEQIQQLVIARAISALRIQ